MIIGAYSKLRQLVDGAKETTSSTVYFYQSSSKYSVSSQYWPAIELDFNDVDRSPRGLYDYCIDDASAR